MKNEEDEYKEEDEKENETDTVDDESYKKIGHNVVSDRSERRISGLMSDFNEGDLVINPIWQRLYVWDDTKASRLIESILLNIPIPMIYVAEEESEGKELVIDGQQRLRSAFRFINNEYSLRGLKVFVTLNGMKFSDLEKDYQRKINRYNFTVVRIRESLSDETVKFDIFERINTGSVNLNQQELRNSLYLGDYNEFLKELAKDSIFMKLYFGQKAPKRMQDVEMVLRFFSFSIEGLHSYTGRLKSFLNNHINKYTKLLENFNDSERKKEQKKLKEMFQKSITLANSAFGEKTFRSCQLKKDKVLAWNPSPNRSLYDAVMYGFIHFEKNQVMNHLDSINEALIDIILNDPAFLPSSQTVSKKNVNYRFNRWRKELDEIITSPIQPRTFSRKLKQELFDNDSTCKICKQAILSIDDSEIDHIKPYWKGGATIPENAQLVHRFCNRSKSGK